MNLFKAHRQWASRPADERFNSLQDLYNVTREYAVTAREKEVSWDSLRCEAQSGEVVLMGKAGVPAQFTHWAFGQLAQRIGAPANYLRDLPATLAVQNLNHGLARRVETYTPQETPSSCKLLFHQNGGLLLRALTSEIYQRFWNWEVAERLLDMEGKGWAPARPTGQSNAAPALYASDHDLFAFLCHSNTIREVGSTEPIYRGIIIENSEVGASKLKATRFGYRFMCGNHIIWDCSNVVEFSVKHVGDIRGRWAKFGMQLREWMDSSASEEEGKIARAKSTIIATTKEAVLDAIFGKRSILIPRKTLEAGYAAVLPSQDGPANSVWGMVQGLTRHSQTLQYADARTQLDRQAGKLMEVDF